MREHVWSSRAVAITSGQLKASLIPAHFSAWAKSILHKAHLDPVPREPQELGQAGAMKSTLSDVQRALKEK